MIANTLYHLTIVAKVLGLLKTVFRTHNSNKRASVVVTFSWIFIYVALSQGLPHARELLYTFSYILPLFSFTIHMSLKYFIDKHQ